MSNCCLHLSAGNTEMNKLGPTPWGPHSLQGAAGDGANQPVFVSSNDRVCLVF